MTFVSAPPDWDAFIVAAFLIIGAFAWRAV